MKKKYETPTKEQLINIANAISVELADIKKENLYVVFELKKELVKQVDEDYFFSNNKDAKESDFTPSDEVEVVVSDIKFKFVEKQDGD